MGPVKSVVRDKFSRHVLSCEEMMNVRGGEGDPVIKPAVPPVIVFEIHKGLFKHKKIRI